MQHGSIHIRSLIFDFGGVLMRTESQQSRDRLAQRLGMPPDELYHTVFDGAESQLEQLGRITPDERWQRTAEKLGFKSHHELLALLRDFFRDDVLDRELVDYVRRMKRRYKTALLSNASAHLAELIRDEMHIEDCFDVIVISALVGLMKPDPAIYLLTLDRLQVSAQEAVFIDDVPANVEAAAALDIHAIRFTTREALLSELDALLGLAREGLEKGKT